MPTFSRIKRSLDLKAPPGCEASAIFKLVAHDEKRYYACWLLVGRYDQDAISVRYRFTGEDTLRCDIPNGTALSAAALQPYLAKFLKDEGTEPVGPPVIIGEDEN